MIAVFFPLTMQRLRNRRVPVNVSFDGGLDGQKIRQPLGLSSSTPTQHPIATRPPSVRTQAFDPQGQSLLRSGVLLVATSKDVAPCNAFVGVRFFNHLACRTASPQRKRGNQPAIVYHGMRPLEQGTTWPLTQLCCGVSCTVNSTDFRCMINSLPRCSPP